MLVRTNIFLALLCSKLVSLTSRLEDMFRRERIACRETCLQIEKEKGRPGRKRSFQRTRKKIRGGE